MGHYREEHAESGNINDLMIVKVARTKGTAIC